jgi:ParB-like chromosome segregation protein Spo0J
MKQAFKTFAERQSRIEIEYRSIESLRSNPCNVRIHTDKQIRQIADSITAFGLLWPILIDQTGP